MKNKIISKIDSMISVSGGVFLLLSVLALCAFYFHIDGLFSYKTIIPADRSVIQMEAGKVYSEEIKGMTDGIRSISIKFGTNQRENEGVLTVRLREEDHILKAWNVDTSELLDNAFHQFKTGRTISAANGTSLFLDLEDNYTPGVSARLSRPRTALLD